MIQRPTFTQIALMGAGAFLCFVIILLVAILIIRPSDIVFPIVLSIPALVIGALVYFIRPWGLIAAVLGGLVALMFSTDGIGLTITSPDAFFDFIFVLFGLLAAALLLIGGIGGLVQHFRKSDATAGPMLANVVKGAVGLVAILTVISAVLTIASTGDVSAAEKEGAVTVTAEEEEFLESEISTTPTGKILIDNKDPVLHTFTIQVLDIDVKAGPFRETVFTLDSVPAGQYGYYCRISGHETMNGILTVR